MKTNSRKTKQTIWLSLAVLMLMLLIGSPQTAKAQWATNVNNINNTNTGNVGIGTTTPNSKLEVSGANAVQRITNTDATSYTGLILYENATQKFNFTFTGSSSGTSYVGGPNAGQIWNSANGPIVFGTNAIERMRLDAAGNVGIGTTSPSSPAGFGQLLHLRGSSNAGFVADGGGSYRAEFAVSSSGGWVSTADTIPLRFATANTERMRIDSSGNVGIGTTSPTAAAGYTALSLSNTTGTLMDFMTSNILKARLQSDGTTFYFNNLANGPIQIYTNGIERMRIDAGGNIGIGGIPNPQYKLDVAGNINSSATITGNNIVAKYQDVAEWVPSSEQLPAGTVVVLDSTKSNQVISSNQAYDTRVAGVISEQPGIALGERGDNKVLVATTGRVRVKVDASRAAIHIGDLLVTSDIAGLAMKSEPVNLGGVQLHRPGTLIGKALEPLEKGSGKILLLLSLQ